MIDPLSPEVKLICAVTYTPEINLDEIIKSLENAFGPVENRSEIIDFDHTDYYENEMGSSLKKILLSFNHFIKADNLWLAKRTTLDVEFIHTREGKRRVNLDPGYLESSKLVLASTKNFSHRIYLGEGIYGEVTLLFAEGSFQKLPWTYPDYLGERFVSFLEKEREHYKSLVRV